MNKVFTHPCKTGWIGIVHDLPWGLPDHVDLQWIYAPPLSGKRVDLPLMPQRYALRDLRPYLIQVESSPSYALRQGDLLDLPHGPDEWVFYCGRRNSTYLFSRKGSPLANPWTLRDLPRPRKKNKEASEVSAIAEVCRLYNLLLKQAIRTRGKGEAQLQGKHLDLWPIWNEIEQLVNLLLQGKRVRLLCWCEGQCHLHEILKAIAFLAWKQQQPEAPE